ncbi:MAG: SSS family solute:Na+ symporter [Flavobacteriales bacterium]
MIGGIKAVIYTDTIQWLILMIGLIFIGLPIAFYEIGGWEGLRQAVPPEFLSLGNVRFIQLFNWLITIVPIWFVGMTLYQRIYACKDEQTAKKAWKIAGLFEWPVMAFMGIALGLFARVAFEQGLFTELGYAANSQMDSELGLPLLLRSILPVGLMGLMMSAYFSAIMSTADSCLMAASGNLITDVLDYFSPTKETHAIKKSQLITLAIGAVAILLATIMTSVLDLMLYSYAFMVSGLLIPVLGTLVYKNPHPNAALLSMIIGGTTTLVLIFVDLKLPLGLDANFFGISLSFITFLIVQNTTKTNAKRQTA